MSRLYTGDFDCSITFRCPDHLKNAIEKQAARLGVDLSSYIRALLRRCLSYDLDYKEFHNEHK